MTESINNFEKNFIDINELKLKFIKECITGTIKLTKCTHKDILRQLKEKGYPESMLEIKISELMIN